MDLWPILALQEVIVGDTPEAIAKRAAQDEIYQTRKNQIKSKFHNNHHKPVNMAATNSTGNAAVPTKKKKKLLFNLKPVRRIRSVQIYSHRYYKTHVLPYVNKALTTAGKLKQGAMLNLSNQITAERLEAETNSIKGEILAALEELSEAEGKRSPVDYLEAIDQAPALLQRFLQEVAEQTGWWFSVIAGGPLPTDNGNIHTQSFHIGFSVDPDDPNGQCRTFEESISVPYGRFLKSLFPSEVHAQRTLNQDQLDLLNDTAYFDMPLASPSPASSSLIPPSIIPAIHSPITPAVASPPPIDPFPSNLLDPAMTPFNSLTADLDFFLVGLQQGPPKNSHLSPHLSPLPPVYDDSNSQQGPPEDLQLPPLLPLPPMYDNSDTQEDFPPLPPLPPVHDNSDMQQGSPPLPPLPPVYDNSDTQEDFPPLPPLPPVHDNSDMQQGSLPLPPLPPVHDDGNTMPVRGAKRAPEHAEEGDNNEVNPEVRASKRARKPRARREVIATGWLTPADLEGLLQVQGCSPGKGRMGALSSRPSALSHWLLNRRYNIYPHLPANFSNELCKWWNVMQPGWRQNKTGTLPLPVYDRSLDSMLWKGGPNGIVTVLVGLMWWGQGTLEADDRVLWTAMVMDIRMCIQAMVTSLSA
ncbi:hypothetical protein IW261DRAFT_1572596 [Armillaria novae-zelandiae]|uniref:Uncharacterized protein n=1 Tax=Armillaria novae-zelandiae TaxID=153914 RepID=A0AA39T827_9AGAR|nr:hypothetical protein IW261DRAFT_1572596 [Armillaria novae-zelandiae]